MYCGSVLHGNLGSSKACEVDNQGFQLSAVVGRLCRLLATDLHAPTGWIPGDSPNACGCLRSARPCLRSSASPNSLHGGMRLPLVTHWRLLVANRAHTRLPPQLPWLQRHSALTQHFELALPVACAIEDTVLLSRCMPHDLPTCMSKRPALHTGKVLPSAQQKSCGRQKVAHPPRCHRRRGSRHRRGRR